jgi:hypothetical protein
MPSVQRFTRLLIGLKRFLVFVPAVIIFLISFFLIFPSLNSRLPASMAVVVLYVATAYITIPLFFRIIRVLRPPTHLPRYSVTPDGLACDPVNIAISGTKNELIEVMQKAGWHKADSRSIKSLTKMALSILMRRPYPTAPFSTLYLLGRGQDVGFQKPIGDERGSHKRHHVRFWACIPAMLDGTHGEHADFWDKLYPEVDKGEVLWLGCASRDIGIVPIKHNFQLTHRVSEDTDTERDIIVADLEATHLVEQVTLIKSGEPLKLKNRALSSSLATDGNLAVIDLK